MPNGARCAISVKEEEIEEEQGRQANVSDTTMAPLS
jgi:hypothetical protein